MTCSCASKGQPGTSGEANAARTFARRGSLAMIMLGAGLTLSAVAAPSTGQPVDSRVSLTTSVGTAEGPARAGRIALPKMSEMSREEQNTTGEDGVPRTNLSSLMDLAPAMGLKLRETNLAMRDVTLPPVEREIITLAVLNLERGEWELAQHRDVIRMMGISGAKASAVAQEHYGDPILTSRERALLTFTRQVVKTVRVDDQTYAAVAAFYSPRQIVETLLVISNYMTLARLTEVTELPMESSVGTKFWKSQGR